MSSLRRAGAGLDAEAPANPNHHLWRNGRRWWIAFTVHTADGRRLRVRRSLETTDVEEARRRRDDVFRRARDQSALRLAGLAARLPAGRHATPLVCR